jgi:IS30 family transposase
VATRQNENINRLLRFWFAKSSDLREHTAEDLKRVQDMLNKRPRPTLDLQIPAARLADLLDLASLTRCPSDPTLRMR